MNLDQYLRMAAIYWPRRKDGTKPTVRDDSRWFLITIPDSQKEKPVTELSPVVQEAAERLKHLTATETFELISFLQNKREHETFEHSVQMFQRVLESGHLAPADEIKARALDLFHRLFDPEKGVETHIDAILVAQALVGYTYGFALSGYTY